MQKEDIKTGPNKVIIPLLRLLPALAIGPATWLGSYIVASSLFIPAMLQRLDSANKISLVALFSTSAMVLCAIANMVAGYLSDRTHSRFGARTPWIVGGATVFALGMILASFSTSVIWLFITWMVTAVALQFIVAPMVAWIDFAEEKHQGTASSAYGGVGMAFGNNGFAVIGALFLGRLKLGFIIFGLICFVGSLLAAILVREPSNIGQELPKTKTKKEHFKLKDLFPGWSTGGNYYLTLLGKMFLGIGNFLISGYLLYIMEDFFHKGTGAASSSIQLINMIMFVFALVLGLVAGPLSDKFKLVKWPVALSSIFVGLGALSIILLRSEFSLILYAILAGFGMGLWNSLDNRLNLMVLPDKNRVAFFLGVYNLANSLPQAIAPIFAAILIPISGYPAVFLGAFIFAALGGILILFVKDVK
ncbi:MFS transporter [Lactiplantibacillus xiangfangensis]|uniref:MFS transporter n=1 Tax=Lactiplantibacillus xiangfangensis TaxID=942150 RepID=UPI00384F674B